MLWFEHIITVPILLPLLLGALLMLIDERQYQVKFWLSFFSVGLLLWAAGWLLVSIDTHPQHIPVFSYQAANWPAPFGISLVVDRLSALMLVLVACVALAALGFSYRRWARAGVHYHSLFMLLLMGMNGALLTGDLFNLFVFFEVMLAASYGLLLHGKNTVRVRAGMNFITLNLIAAFFFLMGIALIYAATGTLNLADLAVKSRQLLGIDKALFEAGLTVLAVTFLAKSGMWPLGFWMPKTYSAAAPPIAAMLTLVTKVGVYVIYRLWLLLATDVNDSFTILGSQLLFGMGLATMFYASLGLLAERNAQRMVSYSAMLSSGMLVALLGVAHSSLIAEALFYWVSSALAVAAFMLLLELTDQLYSPQSIQRAAVLQSLNDEEAQEETPGVVIPAAMAFLGLSFIGCSLVVAGVPPLSGFVAKFGIILGLLSLWEDISTLNTVVFIVMLLLSGAFAIVAFMRLGVRAFWSSSKSPAPKLPWSAASPIMLLLTLCAGMAILAGPVQGYMNRASADLGGEQNYINAVLGVRQEAISHGEYQ